MSVFDNFNDSNSNGSDVKLQKISMSELIREVKNMANSMTLFRNKTQTQTWFNDYTLIVYKDMNGSFWYSYRVGKGQFTKKERVNI